MRIRAAREAQKMTRKMVVQKMQQFLPESEKAVTTRYRGCGAGKGFGV